MPSNNYFISDQDDQDLITQEKYAQLHQDGKLNGHKINQSFLPQIKQQNTIPPQDENAIVNQQILASLPEDHVTPGVQSQSFLEDTDHLEYMSENLLSNLSIRESQQFRNVFV